MSALRLPDSSDDYRLFVDGSKTSLKAALLSNGNHHAAIPLAYSTTHKETYEIMVDLFIKLKYSDHNWLVCVDLKMVAILRGLQGGFVQNNCFLCLYRSRDYKRHWHITSWPPRTNNVIGENNVCRPPIVDSSRIVLPPLHIKLGIATQIIKAWGKENNAAFKYIQSLFPKLSASKIENGIFTGPNIRTLLRNTNLPNHMNSKQLNVWEAFRDVVEHFLGNDRSPDYKVMVTRLLKGMEENGCNLSLKAHFLKSHLNDFPPNCGAFSDEQGEKIHQNLKFVEERFAGKSTISMLGEYLFHYFG